MQPKHSLMFTVPMGLGSVYTFYASRWKGDTVSYFTDNSSHNIEISILWWICTIYFCWDFYLLIRKSICDPVYRKDANTPLFIIHHIVGLTACYFVASSATHLIKYYVAFMTYELTNPYLNVVTQAYKNKVDNLFVFVSQIMFSILFTVVRIIFGSWFTWELIWELYKLEGLGKILILLPFVLQVINYWWYYRIVRLWLKKFGCIKSKSLVKVKIDEVIPDMTKEDLKYDGLKEEVKEKVKEEVKEEVNKDTNKSLEKTLDVESGDVESG